MGLALLAVVAACAVVTALRFEAITAGVPADERANAPAVERAIRVAAVAGSVGVALLLARAAGLVRRPPGCATAAAGAALGLGCLAAVLAVATLWV